MLRIRNKKLSLSLIGIFTMVVAFFVLSGGQASASTFKENDDLNTAKFDLSKNEAQEIEFINEDGEKVVMGAQPELPEITPFATYPIAAGTTNWNIYYYSGAINMSYKITVKRTGTSSNITNAHSLSINLVGYSESNRSFTFTSKKAEYSGTAVLFNFVGSLSIRLTAQISGTNLITSAKG